MHVTNSSLILSVLWSKRKNYRGYLRNCLGFSLDSLIRFQCVRLTDPFNFWSLVSLDEADFHLAAALAALQRVDFVDPLDQHGPG